METEAKIGDKNSRASKVIQLNQRGKQSDAVESKKKSNQPHQKGYS